jgi:ParB-like chromosome segregation protein Spo0J
MGSGATAKNGSVGYDRIEEAGGGESKQVWIREMPLRQIRPHPVNEKVYSPVDPGDPDVQSLAQSIREWGVKNPLVLASDHVILSGHRRYVAAQLAGLETVPCRVEPFDSTDPRCVDLLLECNRQRVKSADEVLREEIAFADPEEATRLVTEYRRRAAYVPGYSLAIKGEKVRAAISAAKEPFLHAVLDILDQYDEYLPLTDRQIHYALLNDPPLRHASKPNSTYRNDRSSYQDLCDLVTRARLDGRINFEDIHDPTRPVGTWHAYRHKAPFLKDELNDFLKGYYRDLMQSQPNHVEILGEKNTVESIIRPVAMQYRIPYTIGRGYSSLRPRYDMSQRFKTSGKEKLVLLILSDFDPEGEDIAHSFSRSMRDEFCVEEIHAVKVALTAEQVREMRLPLGGEAKRGSPRYENFAAQHGDNVYELEAVPPERLEQILTRAIDGVLDVKAFNAELSREQDDVAYLDGVRRAAQKHLGGIAAGQNPN